MNSATPVVSVIIATLNAEKLIRRTLDSLCRQSSHNFECIVVDGLSSDETILALQDKKYSSLSLTIHSEKDDGIGDAWNRGIGISSAPWLMFLGAGDELAVEAVHRICQAATLCSGDVIIVGDTAKVDVTTGELVKLVYGNADVKRPIAGFPFMHPATVTSRSTFDSIGLFNTSISIATDSEFLLRAWAAGVHFIEARHTVIMVSGGISDSNWWLANKQYATCFAEIEGYNPTRRGLLFMGLLIRYLLLKRLKLGFLFAKFKDLLGRFLLALVNWWLRNVPGFALRRVLLNALGNNISKRASLHRGIRLFSFDGINVGDNATINRGVYLDNRRPITIGSNVSIAHDCRIYTLGHDLDDPYFKLSGRPVLIKDHAVLFAGAVILPGVTVGRGAAINAGVLVGKSVPDFTFVSTAGSLAFSSRSKDLRYRIFNKRWLAS